MLDLSLGNDIFKTDIWGAAAQELDILFYTTNTELIGEPLFGSDFESFLWTLAPMSTSLSEYIERLIGLTIFASRLQHHIDVKHEFDETTYENKYVVTITLYDDYKSIEKTYNLNDKI